MTTTTILARPGIRHAATRQLRELVKLRAAHRTATAPRQARIARAISEREARLAAIDAADDDLAELLLLAREDVSRD